MSAILPVSWACSMCFHVREIKYLFLETKIRVKRWLDNPGYFNN